MRFLFVLFLFINVAQANDCSDSKDSKVWIWPQAYVSCRQKLTNKSVYVLQGRKDKGHNLFNSLGPSPHPWKVDTLTLVYRLQDLPKPMNLVHIYQKTKAKWQSHGIKVIGLQLDYDSPTSKLELYLAHLKELRTILPNDEISITGLPDWLNRSEVMITALNKINVPIFFQLYQGTTPMNAIETNNLKLSSFKAPFVVGLLPKQNLNIQQMNELKKNKFYQGLSYFYGSKL
jgi:hypothetical protein